MIGIVGSAYFLGLLSGTVFCGRVIARVGHIRAFTAFAAIAAIACLLHILIAPVWAWALFRIAMGFCSAGLFMIAESWLQYVATNEIRGRIYAFYAIASSAGAGVGPLLINLGDPASYEIFVVGAILFSICLLPVALTHVGDPDHEEASRFGIRELFAISPVAVVGAVCAGLVGGAIAALNAVFAERIGLSAVYISLFVTAMRLGGFSMQYPIGALSDRFDRRRVLICLCLGAAAAALLYLAPIAGLPLIILPLAVIFGGLNQPIYGLIVAHAYDYVERKDFVAASAGLLFAFGLGAIIGPLVAAPAMGALGPSGLFVYAAVVLLGYGGFVAYRMRQRDPVPPDVKTDFVVIPKEIPAATKLDPRAQREPASDEQKLAEARQIERELDEIRWS
jgi:MFS family permease